jgi:phosphoribulokinase
MQRPIVLGIVGDSGAGKTTLAEGLAELLGRDRVTLVSADDYHRWDRAERAALGVSPLDPGSNHLDILELHLERLHYGQPILKPVYDHAHGTLVRPEYVQPRDYVVVEGLLGFHSDVLRQFYDVRVFLDPSESLRRVWKIERDTAVRGYAPGRVLDELARNEPLAAAFVRPQREHAHVVVRFQPPEGVPAERAGGNLDVRLVLRPTIPHPDLTGLLDGGRPAGGVRLGLGRDGGLPVDILEIDGRVSAEEAAALTAEIWRHLPDLRPIAPELFGRYREGSEPRHSQTLALTQLLFVYHVLRAQAGLAARRFAPPVAALTRLRTTGGVRRGGAA